MALCAAAHALGAAGCAAAPWRRSRSRSPPWPSRRSLLAAPARAGTFRVSQCAAVDAGLAPRGYQDGLWWVGGGWPAVDCGHAGGRIRIAAPNHRLAHNTAVDTWLALPGSMPATTMRAAWIDWTSMPQAPSTNPASFVLRSSTARLEEAPSGSSASRRYELPAGTRALWFQTWCSPVNGPGWCNWPAHMLELRGITLELEESGEPGATAEGALLAPGARSGVEPLEVRAADGDSGVRRVAVTLGGSPVGTLQGDCRDDRLPPCPPALRGTLDVDTRAVADGAHRLRVVVTDGAGNSRTLDPATVLVRNQPPAPAGRAAGLAARAGRPVALAAADVVHASRRGRRAVPAQPLAGRGHVRNGTHASERARIRAWLEPAGRRRSREHGGAARRPGAHPRGPHRPARAADRPRDAGRGAPRARGRVEGGDRRADPPQRPLHRVQPDRSVAGAPVRLLRLRRLGARPQQPGAARERAAAMRPPPLEWSA